MASNLSNEQQWKKTIIDNTRHTYTRGVTAIPKSYIELTLTYVREWVKFLV